MRRTGLLRRPVVVAVLAAATTGPLAACTNTGQETPGIEVPGSDGGAQLGIPRVGSGDVLVVQGLTICLDGPGSVPIEEVTALDADGLEVVDFAVRDNPGWDDGETAGQVAATDTRGDLVDAGFEPGEKTATLACEPDTGRGHELGVQVRAPDDGTVGTARGFAVHYADGQVARIPFAVVLCPDQSASSARCSRDLLG